MKMDNNDSVLAVVTWVTIAIIITAGVLYILNS